MEVIPFLKKTKLMSFMKSKEHEPIQNMMITEINGLKDYGSFVMQYNQVYMSRYQKIKDRFSGLTIERIAEINASKEFIIRGIIKKKYKSLVRKVASKKSAMAIQTEEFIQPFVLYGDNDIVDIEDDSGKMELGFTPQTTIHYNSNNRKSCLGTLKDMPYGIVVAIQGELDLKLGKFICKDIYFPQLCQMPKISGCNMEEEKSFQEKEIVVMSNLKEEDYQKIIKFYSIGTLMFKKTILILTGNLLVSPLKGSEKYAKLDQYFDQLSKLSINLVVLPDYVDNAWPAKPLPNFFLPKSSRYIVKSHNPTILQCEDSRILITNGQNISQSLRASPIANPLDIMQSHLIYNHIAPYSPSSFQSIPLSNDLFVLQQLPDVYIATNQSQFSTKTYEHNKNKCCLITVPSMNDGFVSFNTKTFAVQFVSELQTL